MDRPNKFLIRLAAISTAAPAVKLSMHHVSVLMRRLHQTGIDNVMSSVGARRHPGRRARADHLRPARLGGRRRPHARRGSAARRLRTLLRRRTAIASTWPGKPVVVYGQTKVTRDLRLALTWSFLRRPDVGAGRVALGQPHELRVAYRGGRLLSQHRFASLGYMRSVLDAWRDDCNHHRPHSAFGYVPPAVFAARDRKHAGGTSQPPASTTMQPPGL